MTFTDLLKLIETSITSNEQAEAVINKGHALVIKTADGSVFSVSASKISDQTTPDVIYAICTRDYDPATNCAVFVGWSNSGLYYDVCYDNGLDCVHGEALCRDRSIYVYTSEHYEDLEDERKDAQDALDKELWFVKLVLNAERTGYEVDTVFNPSDN